MYVCMYVYLYICISIYMYVCMYIYIYYFPHWPLSLFYSKVMENFLGNSLGKKPYVRDLGFFLGKKKPT